MNKHVDLGTFLDVQVSPALDRAEVFQDLEPVDKGAYYLVRCPACDKREAFVYKDGFHLECNRKNQCGHRETMLEHVAGARPRGEEFVAAVRSLANLAGVRFPEREWSPEELQQVEARQRRGDLMEVFLGAVRGALNSDEGRDARSYLMQRGFPEDKVGELEFGFYPSVEMVQEALLRGGFSEDEIGYPTPDVHNGKPVGAGILYDGRWEGRLVGPWRDLSGRIINFWARDLSGEPGDAKYLYLKGGSKDIPLGMNAVRDRDLVLVEGVLDVAMLQSRGDMQTIACGGASFSQGQVDALQRRRARSVIICLDPDGAGERGTLSCIDQLNRAGIRSYVAPELPGGLDPDEFVLGRGLDAWNAHLCRSVPGNIYRAQLLLREHDLSTDIGKRMAVEALLEYEQGIEDPMDREQMWKLVGEDTGFGYALLYEMADKHRESRRREDAKRDLGRVLDEKRQQLQSEETDPGDLAQEAIIALENLTTETRADAPEPFSVDQILERLKMASEGKRTEWEALNQQEIRFHPEELSLIAARTGHGKTSALLNLLASWLEMYPDEVFIYGSYEVPIESLTLKLLSHLTGKNGGAPWPFYEVRDWLQKGESARELWSSPRESLEGALEKLRAWEDRLIPIYRPSWSVDDLAAYARKIGDDRGTVGAVLVDYLQLIPPPEGSYDRRDIEVSAICRRLKALSVEVACPVVAAAQINRASISQSRKIPTERDFDDGSVQDAIRERRPQLHHLREGGSEQEADLVLGLLNYRADYLAEQGDDQPKDQTAIGAFEILGLKSRYGGGGIATLEWDGRTGTIRDSWGSR